MKQQNNSIKITIIICIAVLVLVLIVVNAFNSVVQPYDTTNTISVNGFSKIEAMPDLVGIYFNIETTGNTSAEAKDANSLIVEELQTELIKLGIEKKEIVTQNFNIYPDYNWDDGKRTEKGYRANHQIRVEINSDDSELIGELIDVGANAGAGISYINFELSQESQNKYKAEAMKLAAQDAKIKADSVAEGFDKKVGDLVSTSINDFGYSPWNIYSSRGIGVAEDATLAKEATTSIQPGEQEITANVNAVFKLK